MPRRRAWRALLAVQAVAGWVLGTAAHAVATPFPLGPPAVGGPVVVRAEFDLRDVNEIDDSNERFEFEGVLTLEWHDDRQRFDPAVVGFDEKVYQGAYQFNEVFEGWFPQVVLANQSGSYVTQGVLLRVRPDGSLTLVQTLTAGAKTAFDLVRYPFDQQRLEAIFDVLGFDSSEVRLEVASPSGVADLGDTVPHMPQWRLTSIEASVREHVSPHAAGGGLASAFVVTLDVERKSLFMVRLVILPLLLITMLSWSVFWMDQSSLGDRLDVSFIGILTVVAYQIVLSDEVAHTSQVTLANAFLNLSFFTMCASVVVNLVVGWHDRRGRNAAGDLIDRRCRWLFPLVYFGLLLLSVVAAYVIGSSPESTS